MRVFYDVRGSGNFDNSIYRNYFYGSKYPTIAYDDNRGLVATEGLKYECNEFYRGKTAITVMSTSNTYDMESGVAQDQGVAPEDGQLGTSAGNYFEDSSTDDIHNQLEEIGGVDVGVGMMRYFWNEAADTPAGVELDVFENDNVDPILNDVQPNQCTSNLLTDGPTKGLMAGLEWAAAEGLKSSLDQMVDGGDTEALLTEVILAQYQDALTLYYELMAKSPSLSVEVILESIQKENELPAPLLSLILQSNPHAAKSIEVDKKLDERSQPLDEYQRMLFAQGKYLTSNKEVLESALAENRSRYERWMGQAIQEMLWDETVTDKVTAMESLLDGRETLAQRYLGVQLYMEAGRYSEAISLLEDIPVSKTLDARKDEEYLDYHTCFSIWKALEEESRDQLTSYEEGELLTILQKRSNQAIGMAQVLLYDFGDYDYHEVLVEPSEAKSNRSGRVSREPMAKPVFQVFPNPAQDFATITGIPASAESIELMDSAGRSVKTQRTTGRRSEIIHIQGMVSGQYEVRCLDDSGRLLGSTKLIVQ